MKLKENFIIHETDGEQIMVATAGSFSGMVRNNATAAFIVNCLKTETTKEGILDAMCEKYDGAREIMAADIEKVLKNLREIGALEE